MFWTHFSSVLLSLIGHSSIVFVIFLYASQDSREKSLVDLQIIEASLAYKRPPPQQQPPPPPSPKTKVLVPKKTKKSRTQQTPDINTSALLEKMRNVTLEEPPPEKLPQTLPETKPDLQPLWSSGKDIIDKGDPYLARVRTQVMASWSRPTLDTQEGVVMGCLRFNLQGKIISRTLEKRSNNSRLNRSVEEALRRTSSMNQAVPEHLIKLLTQNGLCFRFQTATPH